MVNTNEMILLVSTIPVRLHVLKTKRDHPKVSILLGVHKQSFTVIRKSCEIRKRKHLLVGKFDTYKIKEGW